MKVISLTTNLNESKKRPYFLWDESLTVEELHKILSSGNMNKRLNYMAKILREARFEHVWRFLSEVKFLQIPDYVIKPLSIEKLEAFFQALSDELALDCFADAIKNEL